MHSATFALDITAADIWDVRWSGDILPILLPHISHCGDSIHFVDTRIRLLLTTPVVGFDSFTFYAASADICYPRAAFGGWRYCCVVWHLHCVCMMIPAGDTPILYISAACDFYQLGRSLTIPNPSLLLRCTFGVCWYIPSPCCLVLYSRFHAAQPLLQDKQRATQQQRTLLLRTLSAIAGA